MASRPRLPPQPSASKQVEMCKAFEGVVLWLLRVENIFGFSQTTFNLALTIFSRFILSVKVKRRLFHCVTITSLRLAAKVNEEEELVPRVKDFIKHYGSGYSPNELLRMELAILNKLHWDLYTGTPLDFLTIFHTLVVLGWPHVKELLPQRNPSLHVASLTRQLQHCMAGHQLLQFKGSTLALVIITLELERLMPDCCAPISDLLKKAQVDMDLAPDQALSSAP
uniref:Cyclin-G1 n=2 Tax=Sus scrofa TaxID=9823 RepID=A0A4X1UX16_PIG